MNKEERVICAFFSTWMFCWHTNLSDDNIISAYAKSEKGYGF